MDNCRVSKLIFKNSYYDVNLRLINMVWNVRNMKCLIENIQFRRMLKYKIKKFVKLFRKYFINICISFDSLICLTECKICESKMFDFGKLDVNELLKINKNLVEFKFFKKTFKIADFKSDVEVFGDF